MLEIQHQVVSFKQQSIEVWKYVPCDPSIIVLHFPVCPSGGGCFAAAPRGSQIGLVSQSTMCCTDSQQSVVCKANRDAG